ncbi:MAG: aminotransferase class III-fold pyridoxal phosphate-dependent enzyme [Nitrosarchaeum sp.]
MKLNNSKKFKIKARRLIPAQTQTFSRSAITFVEGVYPVYAKSAFGSHFTDVDGNKFLDYLMGLGPITLGYNYKKVNSAVINQLKSGILFSLPHPIEIELTELLCKTIPNTEMVKFEKSGSNAVTGAVRAARAITKKNKIAYCGSGGVWHDWYAASISRNDGVPSFNKKLIKIFDYNDPDGLEQIFDDNKNEISSIVFEPSVYELPKKDFLKKIRKITDKNNAILILDEVVTGFRFDIGGGQKFFDIKGDLICFGKGMGNGLPISAITGKSEFMKIFEKLWVSTTNGSETLSLAGTIATITEMREKKTIQKCWNIGKKLFNGWNNIADSYNISAKMFGYPIRMSLNCLDSNGQQSLELKALILQEMVKQGIFMSPGPSFISYSHSLNDVEFTLNAFTNVCKFIQNKINDDNYDNFLEGSLPKTIYTHSIKPTKKR